MAEAAEAAIIEPEDQEVIQTTLSDEHLPILLKLLHGAADKWEMIATFLQMRRGSIAVVKAEQTDAEKKLFDIIRRWLNETNPIPTAANLVDALRHPLIGENVIARKIEEEFYPQSSMPPQKSISSSATHVVVRSSYHALGFERSESSPPAVALKVATTQQDASTQVDCKPGSRESLGDGHLGTGSDSDGQQAYECMCGKNCSLTDIISGKCDAPKSKGGLFPTLAAKNLSESDRKLLSGEITMQFQQISTKYASLTSSIRASLKQQGITPAQLAEKLMDLEGFLPLRDREGAKHRLLEDRESELSEATSIEKIFRILKEYCSFYNHKIMEYIVEELGTKDDKARLEKYREDFTEYCRRSVFECPFSSGSEKSSHFVDLIMKVDSDTMIKPYTVKAVELFHTQVAKVLQVTKYTLHLWSVEQGCLKVTFHIPCFLKTVIFPLNADQRSRLKELGVAKLDCDGISHPLSELEPERVMIATQKGNAERRPRPPHTHERERELGECLNFKLLGRCKYGNRCKYRHVQPSSNPVEGYVPFPEEHLAFELRSPIGRKGHSRSRKGYVVVQSDRDPTKEVMVIAEDEDALEYARGIIFSQRSETQHVPRPPIPKEDQPCVRLKLLGYCNDDQCPHLHEGITPVENPKRDYVQHPTGKTAILKKCINRVGYSQKKECYLTLASDRHPEKEILVYAESDEALEFAKTQIPVVMGRTYTNLYLSFCYVHPEGVEEPGLTVKFQGRRTGQDYGVVKVDSTPSEEPTPTYSPEFFANLNVEHIPSITSWLNAPTEEAAAEIMAYHQHMRVLREYKGDIHKKLREGLEWMFKNDLQPKLEGRFGKLHFRCIPGDIHDSEGFDVKRLINYLFEHRGYKRFFHSEVAEDAPTTLMKTLLEDADSTTITYDMKLGVKDRGKLDVRLQFIDKKPKVVQVKKDENKILIFDVMCLNREHDMRVSLNSIEVDSPDNPTVQNFLATVTMPADDIVSFVALGPDEEWTVRMLRHKTRKAYFLSSDAEIVDERSRSKYMVTISAVRQYELQRDDLKSCDMIEIGPGDARGHIELELHNLNWEVAVGHQLGLTPEESLILLMEPEKIPADLLKGAESLRWTPDMIMNDFEGDDFFQMMYNLNKAC